MKRISRFVVCAIALAAMASTTFGQPPQGRQRPDGPEEGRRGGQDRGPRDRPGRFGGPEGRPPHPLFEALDTDEDGELSADEIAAAAESLKKLDENGDGRLTREELRPQFGGRGEGFNRSRERGPEARERRRPGNAGRRRPEPPGPGGPGGPGGPPGRPGDGPEGRPFDPDQFADRLMNFDKNDDDQLTADELPERMQNIIEKGDTSGDGCLQRDEIIAMGKPDA